MPSLRPVLLVLALLAAVCLGADAPPRLNLRKDVLQETAAAHAAARKQGEGDNDEDHAVRSLPSGAAATAPPPPPPCEPGTRYENCNLPGIPGPILPHNRVVVTGQFNVYVIFYGAWSAEQRGLVTDFLTGFGATPHYALLRQYGVNGGLVLTKAVTDCYSKGGALSTTLVTGLITAHVTTLQDLPSDTNGLYLILTDPSVTHPSLNTACGWHGTVTVQNKKLLYAYVANPLYNIKGCVCYNMRASPNGDIGVDGMIRSIAQAVIETATNPYNTGWYDARDNEIGEKCAYNFSTPYQTANGAWATLRVGQRDFLVQRYWHPTSNTCVMG